VPLQGGGFIVPEIFSQAQTARFPQLFRRISGPKIALFHDALALQYPELSPAATVARFPQYLQDLLRFDGVAAVSEASRAALLDYWDWLGIRGAPPVAAFPLGLETPPAGGTVPAKDTPVILSVGSLEARKNHGALLDACESLWASGSQFELVLVGLVNRETGRGALDRIERLRSRSRPIRYEGPLGEAELEAAYRACSFTVYPSLAEGFGLPVAESLARGKPCICRGDGALGEIAAGGGCLLMRSADAAEIASAIGGLLSSKQALGALETAAKARRFKTWSRYADELLAWMGTLGWRADA
jgi:glycosyltransferase involved in cell wall biosynthesis